MLKTEQLDAIQYLALPKHGGLTHEQIAEKVGVSRQTLYRWRKEIEFQDELKREIGRNVTDKMGDVVDAMYKEALKGNATAAKLLFQNASMLTDRLEVDDRSNPGAKVAGDIDAMRAEIERIRGARKE